MRLAGRTSLIRIVAAIGALLAGLSAAPAQDIAEIKIGYLRLPQVRLTISLLDMSPPNDGVAGAQLAIRDNNTTGRFLKQSYVLEEMRLKEGDDAAAAALGLADRGISLIIADLPAADLLKVADAGKARGLLLFNAGALDDRLREEDCRANVIHTAPTRSMLADGLAQYLAWKRWSRWFLVTGSHPQD
jgi:ABC transporter substrate binding protein (PQQ-dependent alcohol dehydrogenase system)